MSLQSPTVAIVGATGAVGGELITSLECRDFPLERFGKTPRLMVCNLP